MSLHLLEPPTPRLDRLVKLGATWSGTDKQFMLIQYASKLVSLVLAPRALSPAAKSQNVAISLAKLSALISDYRTFLRLFGLAPILKWYSVSNDPRTKASERSALEQLQILSMLVYYPLEHVCYLASHGIITGIKKSTLDRMSLLSCRAWAAYVFLDLFKGYRNNASTSYEIAAIESASGRREDDASRRASLVALRENANTIRNEAITNLWYAPLTLHWSMPNGLYKNEMWTQVFGTLAAAWQLKQLW